MSEEGRIRHQIYSPEELRDTLDTVISDAVENGVDQSDVRDEVAKLADRAALTEYAATIDRAFYPTECVLCDFDGETHEEYETHMQEVHDL